MSIYVPIWAAEWSEARRFFLPLRPGPLDDPERHSPCATSVTVWLMNDDTWLYGLLYVDWAGTADPDDSGGVFLTGGEQCCGVGFDIGHVPSSTSGDYQGPFDGYTGQLNDLDASPPGTVDIEGTGS